MPLLREVITEYLAAREASGFAGNTLRNDVRVLGALLDATGEIDSRELSAQAFDRFVAVRARTCARSTLNTDLSTTKAFIKWSRARQYMDVDPLADRRWHKIMPRQGVLIPRGDFARVLDCADHPLERMVVATGFYLMTRASETQKIMVGDVDLAAGFVRVTISKTTDRDSMPICEELDHELRRWMTFYTEEMGGLAPGYYLHPRKLATNNRWGGPEGSSRVLVPTAPLSRLADVIQAVLGRAGYPAEPGSREGGHTLRRSAARAMYEELSDRGHDGAIRTVSTWLHHESVTMTERYLDLRVDRVQRDKIFRGQRMFTPVADNVRAISG
jgi:integrase